jgi:DNA processing protein
MITPLTPNTQAILLLTAPLIAGRNEAGPELLSLGEYNRLARLLREKQKEPADLIGINAAETISLCAPVTVNERLEDLLGRGFLLSQAVDRWNARAIWVVSRADPAYPRRIKARLKEDAPPVLYGCGDMSLLNGGGLAVVGSRQADDELIAYTEEVGKLSAKARRPVISGGAKGIDRAAMHGALQVGGRVLGVLADKLEQAALARDNREALMDERLVLISPYDPAAGFNVGHAMQRNKIIYALSDAALVVTSDFSKGGTWAGAIEQLDRLHFVPVFVRNGENAGKGNAALIKAGARSWPNPIDSTAMDDLLSNVEAEVMYEQKQETRSLFAHQDPVDYSLDNSAQKPRLEQNSKAVAISETLATASQELFDKVQEILIRELDQPKSEVEIVELLGISKPQAKAWLNKLLEKGVIEKLTKPARYGVARIADRLL